MPLTILRININHRLTFTIPFDFAGEALSYPHSLFILKPQDVTRLCESSQALRGSSAHPCSVAPSMVPSAFAALTHGNPATNLEGKRIIIAVLQLSKMRMREVITCSWS